MNNLPALPETINLEEFETVYDAIERANAMKLSYPNRPVRPRLEANPTAKSYRDYADKLEAYENDYAEYMAESKICDSHNIAVDALITEFIMREAGLDNIPEKSRTKVWNKAWNDGHSDGYYSVYGILTELVDLFL